MSTYLQIRNLPDAHRRALRARAAARGESLNTYLLGVLDREVARPAVADVLERAARRGEQASASALKAVQRARADRSAGEDPVR